MLNLVTKPTCWRLWFLVWRGASVCVIVRHWFDTIKKKKTSELLHNLTKYNSVGQVFILDVLYCSSLNQYVVLSATLRGNVFEVLLCGNWPGISSSIYVGCTGLFIEESLDWPLDAPIPILKVELGHHFVSLSQLHKLFKSKKHDKSTPKKVTQRTISRTVFQCLP